MQRIATKRSKLVILKTYTQTEMKNMWKYLQAIENHEENKTIKKITPFTNFIMTKVKKNM